MKRLLLLTLATALLIGCLAACGAVTQSAQDALNDAASGLNIGGNDDGDEGDADVRLEELLSGKGTPDIDSLSAADKAVLIAEAAKEGVDLSFGADGSMTVKDTDGSVTTYDGDGHWSYKGADGETAQLGGEWPDDEFTRLVPKPDMTVSAASSENEQCVVTFSGATLEQIKAYAAQIKAAGCEATEETDMAGVYTLSAIKDDYVVDISFAATVASVSIRYCPTNVEA